MESLLSARRHLPIFTALALGAASVALPSWAGPACLGIAAVVGLPHGGLDHVVAQRVFAGRFGTRWWLPFLAGYLALAAGVLLAWHVVPTVMLGTFLLVSIPHFGAEDAAAAGDTSVAAILAHGGVPVVVPALAHPGEVGRIFAVLAGGGGGHVLRLAEGPIAAIWLLGIGVIAWRRVRSTDRRWEGLIELGGTIALFAIATPLTAFAIYFAVVHTPRAFASLRKSLPVAARHRLVARSLPLAIAGIVAGAALLPALSTVSMPDGLVCATFVLLSALTVPHMWLSWLSGRRHQGHGIARQESAAHPPAGISRARSIASRTLDARSP